MNVKTLVFEEDPKPVAFACGDCGTVYQLGCRNAAELCCKPKPEMAICSNCGKEKPQSQMFTWFPYGGRCLECHNADELRKEKKSYDKATKVPESEYTGPALYREGYGNEGFFESFEELAAERGDDDMPDWAWSCKGFGLHIDVDRVLEDALEEHHEDARDHVVDAGGLATFLKEWCSKQTLQSWEPDYSRVVLREHVASSEG